MARPDLTLIVSLLFASAIYAAPKPIGPKPPTDSVPAQIIRTVLGEPDANFAGTWQATFGQLILTQTGSKVTGSYPNGTITGRVEGRKLTFRYTEATVRGDGWFEMNLTGDGFVGKWRADGSRQWADWTGQRGAAAALPPAQPIGGAGSFDGLWNTSFGPMRLRQSGDRCEGQYRYQGLACTISGTVTNGRFNFSYSQPDGERGEGWFSLASADEFTGQWKSAGMNAYEAWTGGRMIARPGVTRLVVLESNWERGLADREYSFGDMLRVFFQRVPNVVVTQRMIHTADDVRRYVGEVAFVPEPTIVYFSSHGTRDGLSLDGGSIKAEEIGAALKGCTNLVLVHFGACELMAGDAAQRVRSNAGAALRGIPISGYANTADWAGSALTDFTYLSLIFEHNLSPNAALDEVRRNLRFASEQGEAGVIKPSLLRIDQP